MNKWTEENCREESKKIAVAKLKILVGQDKTLQQMADILNREGFVTSHGCQFSPSIVRRFIKHYNLLEENETGA